MIRFRRRRQLLIVLIVLIILIYRFTSVFPSVPPYLKQTEYIVVDKFSPDKTSLIVVTACSRNHYLYLNYMLHSLRELNAWVIFYDIGLTDKQKKDLVRWSRFVYRRFPFHDYPSYFDVNIKAGEYAWKPVIVYNTITEFQIDTLWIDAAGYFQNNSIQIIKKRITDKGIYIGSSPGRMRDYTYPTMFKALNASFDDYALKENFEAGFIGFQYRKDIMTNIVKPWRDCALRKECIAPEGSSRANHRQDQSVITYLLHHANFSFSSDRNYASDHVFIKCDTNFYPLIRFVGRYPNLELFQKFCI